MSLSNSYFFSALEGPDSYKPFSCVLFIERKQGMVAIHILVSIYLCIALARVCDYYFVPALESMCKRMNIQPDVAGASLMAIGSSAPELCCSVIGNGSVFF